MTSTPKLWVLEVCPARELPAVKSHVSRGLEQGGLGTLTEKSDFMMENTG